MINYIDYLNDYQYGDREKWQHTAMEVKFFAFDWRLIFAFFPVVIAMFSIYSYIISLMIILFCQALRIRGLELSTLVRLLHFKIIGKRARSAYKYEQRSYRN